MFNSKEIEQKFKELANNAGYEVEKYNLIIDNPNDVFLTAEVSQGSNVYKLDSYHIDPCGSQDELLEYYASILQKVSEKSWKDVKQLKLDM